MFLKIESGLDDNSGRSGLAGKAKSMDRWGEQAGKDFLSESILNGEIKKSDLFPDRTLSTSTRKGRRRLRII